MILPEPRANPFLFGHERAERLLEGAARDRRLHHAWLLCGPSGIGKATLAYRFARALLAGFPGPGLAVPVEAAAFRQVAAGSHPDLLELRCRREGKSDILVEDARDVLEIFTRTAAGAGWRIVIVDGAEALTANAANALLKMLEEPPQRAIFLLTSSAPRMLLPTIRSRCVRLDLRPVGERDIDLILAHLAGPVDEARRRAAAEGAKGLPGRALRACRDPSQDGQNRPGPTLASVGKAPDLATEVLATEILDGIHHAVRRSLEGALPAGSEHGDDGRDMIIRHYERWEMAVSLAAATARFKLDQRQLAIELERASAA